MPRQQTQVTAAQLEQAGEGGSTLVSLFGGGCREGGRAGVTPLLLFL